MNESKSSRELPERNLRASIVTGVVLVVLSPVMSGIGQYNLVWPLALAGVVAALVAFVYSRNSVVKGAGLLFFGSVAMPVWTWFASYALFSADVGQMCGMAIRGVSPDVVIAKSLVPPGVFCFPDGYSSVPILATPLETFCLWLIGLVIVLTPVVAALWLVLRKRSPRHATA